MQRTCRFSVYGVRGAFPITRHTCSEYGGNTSCFLLEWPGGNLVLDAGTGLVTLGEKLARQGQKRVDILLGHLHLDHLLGLVTLPQLYDPLAQVHLYAPSSGRKQLRTQLSRLLGPPFWPLDLLHGQAQVVLHPLRPEDTFTVAGARVRTAQGMHPGGSLLYRLQVEGKSVVYTLDCEPDAAAMEELAAFAQSAELIVWDANFAPEDKKPGWGHSTWLEGVTMRRLADADMVLMTHYDRNYTDAFLHEQQALAAQLDTACRFAKEGMEIEL